jgi:hypothetical protein
MTKWDWFSYLSGILFLEFNNKVYYLYSYLIYTFYSQQEQLDPVRDEQSVMKIKLSSLEDEWV